VTIACCGESGEQFIDITMETSGREQVDELLAALTTAGYRHSRVI
jgi:threonine dehydratase